jgi:hypothetical protein
MNIDIKNSSFIKYNLTNQQILEGSTLNSHQLFLLQNDQAIIAEQKLRLVLDTNKDIYDFVQQEAYLRGQLDFIDFLKDRAESVLNSTLNTEKE